MLRTRASIGLDRLHSKKRKHGSWLRDSHYRARNGEWPFRHELRARHGARVELDRPGLVHRDVLAVRLDRVDVACRDIIERQQLSPLTRLALSSPVSRQGKGYWERNEG